MTTLAEVLSSLSNDDAKANISNIKGAIAEQLRSTDSRVKVEPTEYFNHSFVPDLVLTWPELKEKRFLFLRTSFRDAALRRDVDTLSDSHPILMPLGDERSQDVEGSDGLEAQAKSTNTLIASPAGLDVLIDQGTTRPVVSLLSHAVLQGGRGVVTPVVARRSSEGLAAGFDGAQTGDASTTEAAIESVDSILDSQRSGQINRLLHAVWIGSGSPGSAFPGAAGITATLDAESLRFILDLPDLPDDDFWRRIGSGLTIGRLCELVDYPDSDNLQRLLRDNAYRLDAKACRVVRGAPQPSSPRWSVTNRTLVLSVESDRIHYAPSKQEELPAPVDAVAVSIAQLQSRATDAGLKVREVRLTSGDHSLAYTAQTGEGISGSDELAAIQRVMSDPQLISAVVWSEPNDVLVQFGTRTASGNGRARFSLSALADVVVPLLIDPATDALEATAAMLEQPASSRPAEDPIETPAGSVEQAEPTPLPDNN